MNYPHFSVTFRSTKLNPILIGIGLLVASGLIAGLANADIYLNTNKRAVITAKKLDVNDDGLISLDELTNRQDQSLQKLGRNNDGQHDKAEYNERLLAMFRRIDGNGDGMLDDNEILVLKHRHYSRGHNNKGLH